MTVEQASHFLTSSILFMLGVLVIVSFTVLINNIIHKFWKSFGWKFFPAFLEGEQPEQIKDEPKLK